MTCRVELFLAASLFHVFQDHALDVAPGQGRGHSYIGVRIVILADGALVALEMRCVIIDSCFFKISSDKGLLFKRRRL